MSQIYQSIVVKTGLSMPVSISGKVMSVKSSTLPISIAFDGRDKQPAQSGTVLRGPFKFATFTNSNAVDVTVNFFVGDDPVAFSPQDNSASNASSYSLGNLGIATSAGAAGGLPGCDANGFLQITDSMGLVVSGSNNGHRRQQIFFSTKSTSAAPLNVLDANGFAFMTIPAGQVITILTDSTYILSGAGGIASVTVGQIFLAA